MKRCKDHSPDQQLLLPPHLDDWLAEGHLAYFIRDVVGELDLSRIYADYKSGRGGQPAGIVKLGHVALEDTKMQANASKHKAMSYGRMKQEIARLEGEVTQLRLLSRPMTKAR